MMILTIGIEHPELVAVDGPKRSDTGEKQPSAFPLHFLTSGPRSSRRRRSSALSYLIQDAAREGEGVEPAQVNQTLISRAVDVAEGLLLAAMCHDISN